MKPEENNMTKKKSKTETEEQTVPETCVSEEAEPASQEADPAKNTEAGVQKPESEESGTAPEQEAKITPEPGENAVSAAAELKDDNGKESKKRHRVNFPLLIAIFVFIAAACFAVKVMYEQDLKRLELEGKLAQAQMELAIRETALENIRLADAEELRAAEDKRELREGLQKDLLRARQDEFLMLVNPWNEIDPNYSPELVDVSGGMLFDARAAYWLNRMLSDCRAAGCYPEICSLYRTQDYQAMLYDNKVERVLAQGYDYYTALDIAAMSVAVPGTSEHQLGLAADLVDFFYGGLDYYQEYTDTQQWLMAHCTDYGFILRYPNGTSDITGIIYEPWHYRYVGRTVAAEMKDLGVTLEEYLAMRNGENVQ